MTTSAGSHTERLCFKSPGHPPFHPVLIAAYVVLMPYAANQGELYLADVLPAILTVIVGSAGLLFLTRGLLQNRHAAGLVTTLTVLCIAYYGHVFDALNGATGGLVQNDIFVPVWITSFAALAVLAFIYRARLENLSKILNVSALVIVLAPLGSLLLHAAGETRADVNPPDSKGLGPIALASAAPITEGQPDIYYLIFDRYADRRTLRDTYNFDNGPFLNRLEELGFYVADQSKANYTKTAYSLASTLNLSHLTYLSERVGPGSTDWKPIYSMLRDHKVARFLKARGYRYVHLGSWWGPTKRNVVADENFEEIPVSTGIDLSLNEFEWLLVEPTLLARSTQLLPGNRRQQFIRVNRKFEKLAELKRGAEPLFVFAHILVPHDPFVFFADGRYKTEQEAASVTRDQNYIDHLAYANKKIKELVQTLLKKDPQPIIIIQSDEGPFPARYVADTRKFDWREATPQEIRQKYGILNAIYFPDRAYDDLYEDITPINTFPVVFNRYFGQNLPPLPDRSYSHYSVTDLYSFFEVTEVTK